MRLSSIDSRWQVIFVCGPPDLRRFFRAAKSLRIPAASTGQRIVGIESKFERAWTSATTEE